MKKPVSFFLRYNDKKKKKMFFDSKSTKAPIYVEPLLAAVIGAAYQMIGERDPAYRNMMQIAKYGAIVGVANLVSTQGTGYLMPEVFTDPKMKHIQHAALNAGVTAGLNIFLQQALSKPKDLRVMFNAQAGALAGGGASLAASAMW